MILVMVVVLHSPDGSEISINPALVTTMREAPPGAKNKNFTEQARCMLNTSDGKFVTVVETCATIRELFGEIRNGVPLPRPRPSDLQ